MMYDQFGQMVGETSFFSLLQKQVRKIFDETGLARVTDAESRRGSNGFIAGFNFESIEESDLNAYNDEPMIERLFKLLIKSAKKKSSEGPVTEITRILGCVPSTLNIQIRCFLDYTPIADTDSGDALCRGKWGATIQDAKSKIIYGTASFCTPGLADVGEFLTALKKACREVQDQFNLEPIRSFDDTAVGGYVDASSFAARAPAPAFMPPPFKLPAEEADTGEVSDHE